MARGSDLRNVQVRRLYVVFLLPVTKRGSLFQKPLGLSFFFFFSLLLAAVFSAFQGVRLTQSEKTRSALPSTNSLTSLPSMIPSGISMKDTSGHYHRTSSYPGKVATLPPQSRTFRVPLGRSKEVIVTILGYAGGQSSSTGPEIRRTRPILDTSISCPTRLSR